MRLVMLNTLTGLATLALLVVLALPAKDTLDGEPRRVADGDAALPRYTPAVSPRRVFGVYIDPWHVDDWSRAIGAAPQAVAKFEAFSRDRPLGPYGAESIRQGIHRMMIAWEPWRPVPSSLGVAAQSAPQRGYRNVDVARAASRPSPARSTCATRTR